MSFWFFNPLSPSEGWLFFHLVTLITDFCEQSFNGGLYAMVKFDEKTLAAERRTMPFILLIGLVFLLAGILMASNPLEFTFAVLALGIGIALFSAGIFWWIDRQFHEDD
jgi:hypothetical protein